MDLNYKFFRFFIFLATLNGVTLWFMPQGFRDAVVVPTIGGLVLAAFFLWLGLASKPDDQC